MPLPEDIDAHPAKHGRPVIEDPDQALHWTFQPVGVVHSSLRNHFAAPRQPGQVARLAPVPNAAAEGHLHSQQAVGAHSLPPDARDAWILLRHGLQNCARDLRGFDYAWIVFVFNYSRGGRHTVVPPRDTLSRGVFSTRSPHRPNPIGLSCVRVLNVVGRRILIRDHDLLHGTPVLDIKPYLPYCDAHPQAKAGYVDTLAAEAPDHRWD